MLSVPLTALSPRRVTAIHMRRTRHELRVIVPGGARAGQRALSPLEEAIDARVRSAAMTDSSNILNILGSEKRSGGKPCAKLNVRDG